MKAARKWVCMSVFLISFSGTALFAVRFGELQGKSQAETISYLLKKYVEESFLEQHIALIEILLACPAEFRYELASQIHFHFADLERRRAHARNTATEGKT